MVLFQNKVIHMPSVPPFSRSEKVESYRRQCQPVEWREHYISTPDGIELSLVVGSVAPASMANTGLTSPERAVILHFQGLDGLNVDFDSSANICGNGSSLPPRSPYLPRIVENLNSPIANGAIAIDHFVVALSYRRFGTSRHRPSRRDIEIDALVDHGVELVLWGEGLGADVASVAAVQYHQREILRKSSRDLEINGLLLETPFLGVRQILVSLYPRRCLPYRYLGPFLRSHWDSMDALRTIASSTISPKPGILILRAGKDEVVPYRHGLELEEVCRTHGLSACRSEMPGALHTKVVSKEVGQRTFTTFNRNCGQNRKHK